MFNFLTNLMMNGCTGGTGGTAGQSGSNPAVMIILLVGMLGVMYFVTIRPQKKKQKEEQQLRDSVQIGDDITSIGGIVGRVVTVKEDSIVIETGADRNKMKLMRWAIQDNNTGNERAAAEKAALEAAQKAEKEERKTGKRRSKKSDDVVDETAKEKVDDTKED